MATTNSSTRTYNTESSGTSLNSKFYLQNFYRINRNLTKASARPDYNNTELSYEDSRALKRAASTLSSFNYTEDENGDNIVSSIQAFVETYNNTLESSNTKDADVYRQNRQLKAMTDKYGDDLKNLGITIEDNGKLTVSENILKGSSFDEVKKVFSEDSEYMKSVKRIAKRMHATSEAEIYVLMTGNGGRVNIQL